MILFPDTFTAELLSIFSRYAQIIAEFFLKSTDEFENMFGLLFPLHITAHRRFPAFRPNKRTRWKTQSSLCVPWLPPTGMPRAVSTMYFRMKQRFLCGNGRLTVKYIHRSSCDPSFVQSLCQCLAVYTFSFGCSFLHFSVQ